MFSKLLDDSKLSERRDALSLSFNRLDQAVLLLTYPSEEAEEFTTTLTSLNREGKGRAEEASIAAMIYTCLYLRDSPNIHIYKSEHDKHAQVGCLIHL